MVLMENWEGQIQISFNMWLQVILLLLIPRVRPVTSQPGFLSIDCGSDVAYNDTTTGIFWETDAKYISTGKNAITTNAGVDNTNLINTRQLGTLRFFDESRSKDCYVLPMTPNQTYLVRPTFFYGDWMNGTSTISFSVYLNNTFFFSKVFGPGATTYLTYSHSWEAIIYSPGGELNFCLVQHQGPSFISSLEIRQLASGMYSAAGLADNVYLCMALDDFERVNCGASQSDLPFLRYPDDAYDRIWFRPYSDYDYSYDVVQNVTDVKDPNIMASLPSTSVPDRPPLAVMQEAWVDYGHRIFKFPDASDNGVPMGRVYITSYFQEVDGNASATNERGIIYTLNGKVVTSFNTSDKPFEIYGPPVNIPGDYLNISFQQASWSTLPPILNAYEIYYLLDFDISNTAARDVSAILALQKRINFTGWTGDPCLPEPYDWIKCTADNNIPTLFRVTQLSLGEKGINGTIPPEILNLTALTDLSLNDNDLTGSIPDLSSLVHLRSLYLQNNFLSGNIPSYMGTAFPNLTELHVENNSLDGIVPPDLFKSGLDFTYINNPNLICNITGCSAVSATNGNRPITGVVVGAILGVLAIVALALIFGTAWFLRVRARKKTRSDIIRAMGNAEGNLRELKMLRSRKSLPRSIVLLSLQQVSDATKKFSRKIGEGSFGPVYHGQLPDGQEVAVKVKSAMSRQGLNEFLNEIDVLSRIHHRNLVSLVAYCEEAGQQILVYVYVSNGTVRDHLAGEKSRKLLNWKTRLDIARDSALGLDYLHTACTPRIIHRDVKSSNILLDENMIAKVSDFGISKEAPEGIFSGVSTVLKGTPGYFDPEYFKTQRLTPKSDVYSFGVVLLEIISGRRPIFWDLPDGTDGTIIQWAQWLVRDGKNMDVFDPSLGGKFDQQSGMVVVSLALACINPETSQRPDMGQVVRGITEAIGLEFASNTTPKLHVQ